MTTTETLWKTQVTSVLPKAGAGRLLYSGVNSWKISPLTGQRKTLYAPYGDTLEKASGTMALETEEQRFRSFTERWLIARASTFKKLPEDTWRAVQDATTAWKMVKEKAACEYGNQPGGQQTTAIGGCGPPQAAVGVLATPFPSAPVKQLSDAYDHATTIDRRTNTFRNVITRIKQKVSL
jgi:hypothetical protein